MHTHVLLRCGFDLVSLVAASLALVAVVKRRGFYAARSLGRCGRRGLIPNKIPPYFESVAV